MNILITGGAGYVGRCLIDKLEDNSMVDSIIVIDNMVSSNLSFFTGKKKLKKLKFIKGDILNFDLLEDVVKEVDVIYHLAAYTKHAYTYEQNIQYEQVNQWGTLNLVRAIEKSATRLKKVIYLSSMSVYGLRNNIDLEKDQPQPTNAYGVSKYEGEKYISLLAEKYSVEIIRSGNVFGFNTGFREDLVLNNFVFNGLVKGKITIYGNGEQVRPFTFLNALCNKLDHILLEEETENPNYHNIIDFSASLNELKDWLLLNIPNLEYTYLNSNLNYEEQDIRDLKNLKEYATTLNKVFLDFKENLKFNYT